MKEEYPILFNQVKDENIDTYDFVTISKV